jgi:crotonobetaine/carnitine-CoA ligase
MGGLPEVSERTLRAAYDRALAAVPDELAQIGPDGQYTFAQSHDRSLRIAGGLGALGVGRQEPVALLLDNSLDAVHTWSGIGLGGMVEVPVNSAYKGSFLTHVLNDSGASTLVCEAGYAERIAAVASDLTALRTLVVQGDLAAADGLRGRFNVVEFGELTASEAAPPRPIDAGDLMAYMYTSGTTGLSKGVLISHAHAYTYASREDQARPVATGSWSRCRSSTSPGSGTASTRRSFIRPDAWWSRPSR